MMTFYEKFLLNKSCLEHRQEFRTPKMLFLHVHGYYSEKGANRPCLLTISRKTHRKSNQIKSNPIIRRYPFLKVQLQRAPINIIIVLCSFFQLNRTIH